jgi:hypothetical protein
LARFFCEKCGARERRDSGDWFFLVIHHLAHRSETNGCRLPFSTQATRHRRGVNLCFTRADFREREKCGE